MKRDTIIMIRNIALVWLAIVIILLAMSRGDAESAPDWTGALPEAERPPVCAWEPHLLAVDVAIWQLKCGDAVIDMVSVPIPPPAPAQRATGPSVLGFVTGYYCQQVAGWPPGDGGGYCGTMANGEIVYPGAAACGAAWALGTVLDIEGYGRVVCADRGLLGYHQVDIFFETNEGVYASGVQSTYRAISEVLR